MRMFYNGLVKESSQVSEVGQSAGRKKLYGRQHSFQKRKRFLYDFSVGLRPADS